MNEKAHSVFSSFYAYPLHNPGPFVYYQSLLSKTDFGAPVVANSAQKYLYGASSLVSPDNDRGRASIQHVMSTLQKMIAYESAKEIKALADLQKRAGTAVKGEKLPSPLEEPFEFIAELNKAMKSKEDAKIQLEQERTRIAEAKKEFNGKTKKEINKMIKLRPELADLLHNMSNTIEEVSGSSGHLTQFTSLAKSNSNSSKIISKILQQYGAKIIGVKNGELQIKSGSALNIILGLITSEIEREIYQKHGKINGKIIDSYLEKIDQKSNEITRIIDQILQNHEEIEEFANSIGDSLIIDSKYHKALRNNTAAGRSAKLSKQLVDILQTMNLDKNDKELAALARQYAKEAVASTNAITIKPYVLAETFGAIDFRKLAISAWQSGGYAKDDVGAISITLSAEYENDKRTQKLKEKVTNLWRNAMKSKTYKEGTAEEYQKNSQIVADTLEQIEKEYELAAKEMGVDIETLKEIIQTITYHDNVKSYDTISTKTGAFSGGSIGNNITEQLTNFANLLQLSGYGTTQKDTNWLASAVINTGNGLLGESMKGSLEGYFSTLMGLLLFEDAYYTIKRGVETIDNALESSTAEGVHLYLLGGQYVPASFILNETYNSLSNTLNQVPSHGVTVSIKARPAQNKTFTSPHDWVVERNAALKEANISINFMAGFLGFLDNLNKAFNS